MFSFFQRLKSFSYLVNKDMQAHSRSSAVWFLPLSVRRSVITSGGTPSPQSSLKMTRCSPSPSAWRTDPNATVRDRATRRATSTACSRGGTPAAVHSVDSTSTEWFRGGGTNLFTFTLRAFSRRQMRLTISTFVRRKRNNDVSLSAKSGCL